jgi:hypothetical protein
MSCVTSGYGVKLFALSYVLIMPGPYRVACFAFESVPNDNWTPSFWPVTIMTQSYQIQITVKIMQITFEAPYSRTLNLKWTKLCNFWLLALRTPFLCVAWAP